MGSKLSFICVVSLLVLCGCSKDGGDTSSAIKDVEQNMGTAPTNMPPPQRLPPGVQNVGGGGAAQKSGKFKSTMGGG